MLASVDEPWGLSINEVMNAGRPVIVTSEVGCQKNLAHDGLNGCVIPAGDIDALAESIRAVLASRETRRAMGAQSLRIVNEYNFKQNVAGLRQALHAVSPAFALPTRDSVCTKNLMIAQFPKTTEWRLRVRLSPPEDAQ